MTISIERIDTERFSMRFFRFGKGSRTMVILPGLSVRSVMHAAEAIRNEYEVMEKDFTVYVFDRREDLPSCYSIREMARDTAEAIQNLGLQEICLFGASQGGMIAQEIAIGYPEMVYRMVLGSTTSHMHYRQYFLVDDWIRLAERKARVSLYLSFGEAVYPYELFQKHRNQLIAASRNVTDVDLDRFVILARGIRGFNVTEKLNRIQCPVLTIGVFEDPIVDSDATMEIAEYLEKIPGYQLYMYCGYGHSAFDTAPDYRERILNFFLKTAGQKHADT